MTTFPPARCAAALALHLAWAIALFAGRSSVALADEPPPTSASLETQSRRIENGARQIDKHWLGKLTDALLRRETHENARNHASVLNAFRDTVRLPAKCTVGIWCDEQQVALGTIIDPEGFIVTKASELHGAVECQLRDGTRHSAQLTGVDRGSDMALLKIDGQGFPAIPWSDSDPPSVGGWVITPGLDDLPLAIGIVSVAPHFVRGGVLGIQMTEDELGPRVTFVVPGSGAAAAGLLVDDVITRANGKRLKESDEMVAITSNLLPGDKVHLSILRQEKTLRLTAALGSVADTLTSARARFQSRLGGPLSKRRFLFPSVLEHDCALAPSQCGGVLVNVEGEAIGVNIARASRISSYAIPVGVARPILQSLKSRATEGMTVPIASQLPESGANEVADHP